jgi:hypothetical protein
LDFTNEVKINNESTQKKQYLICKIYITTEELTVVVLSNQSTPQEEPKREIQQNANVHPCSIEIK